jgi:hypothetical protein
VGKQLPQLPAQMALLSALMAKNAFRKISRMGLGQDLAFIGILNSSMILKIEF